MDFDPTSAKPVADFDPASAKPVAPAAPTLIDLMRGVNDASLETGRTAISSTVGPLLGGLSGIPQLLNPYVENNDQAINDFVDRSGKTQQSFDEMLPRVSGAGADAVDRVMELPAQAGGYVGRKAQDFGAPPSIAAGFDVATQILPFALMDRLGGGAHASPVDAVRAATAPDASSLAASEHITAGEPNPITAQSDQGTASLLSAVQQELSQSPPAPSPVTPVAPPVQEGRVATPAKPGEQPTPVPPPPANIAAMLDNAPDAVKQSAVGQLAEKLRQPGALETQAGPHELPEVTNGPASPLRTGRENGGNGTELDSAQGVAPEAPAVEAPTAAPEIPPAEVAGEKVDSQAVEQNVSQAEIPGRNPITDRISAKLRDHDSALAEYSSIPETKGGTVLNVDTARELSSDYLNDRTKSADVHEPASAFIKRVYAEKLAAPTPEGHEPTVLFTAGGTGAGKSTGIGLLGDSFKPEITYDTNMNSYDSAKAKIEQALDAGRSVKLLYTYRDPVEALRQGALPRAMRQERQFGSGRTVPLAEHEKTHTGAHEVVNRLAQEYNGDSRVEITAVDNSRGKGNAQIVPLDQIPSPHKEGLREQLNQQLEQAHGAGEISDSIRAGFQAESQRPGMGASDRGQPQQERAGRLPAQVARPVAERVSSPARSAPIEDSDVAVAERPAPPAKRPSETQTEVSARNAAVDADRIARDLPEIPEAERQEWSEPHAEALSKIESDSSWPKRLAAEVSSKPRPLTATETMGLTHDLRALTAEHSAATKAVLEARAAGDTIGESQAIARQKDAEGALTKNHEAIRVGGTEAARALSIRNAIVKDDYSIGRNMDRAKAAYGDRLSADTKAAVEHLSQKIKEQDERIAQLEKQREAKSRPKSPDDRMQGKLKKQLDELESQIQARMKACPI